MITTIVFSKDRPLQLDLCLSSIRDLFPQCSKTIVIHNNSEEFSGAYSVVKSEHKDVDFWPQFPCLFNDVQVAIESSDNEYICFMTDDCFVYDKIWFDIDDFFQIFSHRDISCFSLRLGLNIDTRQMGDSFYEDKPKNDLFAYNKYLLCSKTSYNYGSYWSYSLSVDGHIFRKDDLLDMVRELVYLEKIKKWKQTPNSFEEALQRFWPLTPNFIAFYQNSKVVNSPNNMVQNTHKNRSGDTHGYNKYELLNLFKAGKRINRLLLDTSNIRCPHTEIDLLKGVI